MDTRTLLLNTWGQPHSVLGWDEAICLVYQEKVVVLEEYDETVSSPSTTYFIPAVMMLKNPVATVKKGIKFNRINVFTRDGFRCQYCGHRKTMKELNFDHVLPRKQGGKTVWDNIVTSCYPCNDRKGAKSPEQARMNLLRKPAKPSQLPLHAVFLDSKKIPPMWEPYLNLNATQHHGDGVYMVSVAGAA